MHLQACPVLSFHATPHRDDARLHPDADRAPVRGCDHSRALFGDVTGADGEHAREARRGAGAPPCAATPSRRSTSTSRSTASATTTRRARCTCSPTRSPPCARRSAATRCRSACARPDPAAGHPRQPGRLRRDHLHQQRHAAASYGVHIDGLAVRDRLLGRRDRQQRPELRRATARRRTYRYYVPDDAGPRGHALHPPRPRLPHARSPTASSARSRSSRPARSGSSPTTPTRPIRRAASPPAGRP